MRTKRQLREEFALAQQGVLPGIRSRDGRGTPTWTARRRGIPRKDFRNADSFAAFVGAWNYLESTQRQMDAGTYTDPRRGRVTLSDYFTKWIDGDPLADPPRRPAPLEPSTQRLYRGAFAKHIAPTLGHLQLVRITRRALKDWIAGLEAGVGPRTIGVCHALVRRLLAAAIDEELLTTNPAARIELPQVRHQEMIALEAQEVARLADAAGGGDRVLILTLAFVGMRVGEALALRVGDLHLPAVVDVEVGDADLARGTVTISKALKDVGGHLHVGPTKTKGSRPVSLPRFLVDELRAHVVGRGDDEILFPAAGGGYIRLGNWRRRVFQPAACAAGLGKMVKGPDGVERYEGLRVHDLRHSAASILHANGASIVEISKRLGHRSPNVTQTIYAHLLKSRDEELTAGLDRSFAEASASTPSPVVGIGVGS